MGTMAPTTADPSAAPTTPSPSGEPTKAPTSSAPTMAPTTADPSAAPTTPSPSGAPTGAPTSSAIAFMQADIGNCKSERFFITTQDECDLFVLEHDLLFCGRHFYI